MPLRRQNARGDHFWNKINALRSQAENQMRKKTLGLSEFLTPVFALLASRHVLFFAVVLVGVTLSVESARGREPCDEYDDKYDAAPEDSYEELLYDILIEACDRGGVRVVKAVGAQLERGLSRPCDWYRKKKFDYPFDSFENNVYHSLHYACEETDGVDLIQKVRQERIDKPEPGTIFKAKAFVDRMVKEVKKEIGDDVVEPALLILPIEDKLEGRSRKDIKTNDIDASIRIPLSNSDFFTVVSREKLKVLLEENSLDQIGLADPDTAVKLGELVGAKYVLHGFMSDAQTNLEGDLRAPHYRIVLELTEIETGKVLWAAKTDSRNRPPEAPLSGPALDQALFWNKINPCRS